MNERIRISPIMLLDENGEKVGVVETDEARMRARDLGLDLVEIAADVRPPVCKIMDYGKYKYEKSKKARANKTKATELKEVRLGRSMKIDQHDIEIRLKQARKFLLEGHKVQIVQNFRGREMAHKDRGNQRMNEIVDQMEDIAKVELYPRMAGRRMTMVLAPDKAKIQSYRQTHGLKEGETGEEDAEAPVAGSNLLNTEEASALMDAVETSSAAPETTSEATEATEDTTAEEPREDG
ncbi:MAG: translation initiation factor IF-3 [Phycisphaerales bacterium]|nr:translation initiation factor IF-3 [Phycisphaerales bacterium]